MLKCDEKFLWNLLSLTQEGNFKAGRFALISADELIVAHTNEAEYKAFISNKKNEALQSQDHRDADPLQPAGLGGGARSTRS